MNATEDSLRRVFMEGFTASDLAEKVVKQLERLRNNLAHSQGIIEENWEAIVLLAETMDRVLTVPEHLSVENSLTPFESERRT